MAPSRPGRLKRGAWKSVCGDFSADERISMPGREDEKRPAKDGWQRKRTFPAREATDGRKREN